MDEKYTYEVHPLKTVLLNGRYTRLSQSASLTKKEVLELMSNARVYRKYKGEIVVVTGDNIDKLHRDDPFAEEVVEERKNQQEEESLKEEKSKETLPQDNINMNTEEAKTEVKIEDKVTVEEPKENTSDRNNHNNRERYNRQKNNNYKKK